jgi:hypothetical protein
VLARIGSPGTLWMMQRRCCDVRRARRTLGERQLQQSKGTGSCPASMAQGRRRRGRVEVLGQGERVCGRQSGCIVLFCREQAALARVGGTRLARALTHVERVPRLSNLPLATEIGGFQREIDAGRPGEGGEDAMSSAEFYSSYRAAATVKMEDRDVRAATSPSRREDPPATSPFADGPEKCS